MADSSDCVGCAFLFLKSTSTQVDLPSHYKDLQTRPKMFGAIKDMLADVVGDSPGYEILKILSSDPQLVVQVKFNEVEKCRQFLRIYKSGTLQQLLQERLRAALLLSELEVQTELKASSSRLDDYLEKEDHCLSCISEEKPDHQKDEDISRLEECLKNLTVESGKPITLIQSECFPVTPGNTGGDVPQEGSTTPSQFVDRPLTAKDHQAFATLVGRSWKKVGRSLAKDCRALRDPTIENIAFEFEREGLYEQAYQLIQKFKQAEGKKATLGRLIEALQDSKLQSLADELMNPQEQ
ncbi:tumor necrosis factor receptor type 1-associated DEATH domain protein [Latimeria chalumnae]|uniref:tumor necrosis factor receptor type 1-associated DEATH domain protein n=1 Tax=Latimeria chalumnae TaxID=7897 RepID=UPI0003C1A3F4|nr:PREDICTED: tumor necrosis factor receptor type 1-associated DEATH domain protein [Latimeria chalumnae]|eukprot:XP_005998087.1 PREDICTED: tumor necrosis factor receptor type 1-associated DEATH domain protein [Latimeria chalumnae]